MERVRFERVSKRYSLGQRLNAREALAAAASRLLHPRRDPDGELWSLRDVSFSVSDGDALGIVGRNGAGKSTILKILAGITAPTSGVSSTRGRVAALLEVGTGFHPELSGRENVYLNGAILGMSRRDITSRFDQIVDFSGVERFLDTPVKRYSSGMYLRLAFAVAAHLEPDVLVVDEILAVGDAEFQRKCIGRMEEAEQEGRALVFVSHDLESLARLCPRSLWLEAGRIRETGSTGELVRHYLESGFVADTSRTDSAALVHLRSDQVTVDAVRVLAADNPTSTVLMREDSLRIEVDFHVTEEVPGLDFSILVTTRAGVRVLDELMSDSLSTRLSVGAYRAGLTVPPMLNLGDYTVGLWFGTQHEDFLDQPVTLPFTLHGNDPYRSERLLVTRLPLTVSPLVGA